jgi:hypothetical protein
MGQLVAEFFPFGSKLVAKKAEIGSKLRHF